MKEPIMTYKTFTLPAGFLLLGACAAQLSDPAVPTPSANEIWFEQVAALAGPNQNLETMRLREEDNCFWVSYEGVVETVELPLRTADGQNICAPSPAEPTS
tara:strand:- start:939 stop:1241 length:303 start_codon:yes stop_codon:yes gene_type:complete